MTGSLLRRQSQAQDASGGRSGQLGRGPGAVMRDRIASIRLGLTSKQG
jgi:hypothetical protein